MPNTLYATKAAVYDLLAARFAAFTGRERIDVFYGWREVDSTNRVVVVTEGATGYEDARLGADSSLYRYDITHSFSIDCASGMAQRTEREAERQCEQIAEQVRTLFLRGDSDGMSALEGRVPAAWEMTPGDEQYIIRLDARDDPAYSVLRLPYVVSVLRE